MKLILIALVGLVCMVQADGDWQNAVDNIDLYHISELRVTLMSSKSAKTLPDKCKLLWRGISAKMENQSGLGSSNNLYPPLVIRRLRSRLDNRPAFVKLWAFIDECVEVLSGNYKIPNESNCDEISAVAMRNKEIMALKKRLSDLENDYMALLSNSSSDGANSEAVTDEVKQQFSVPEETRRVNNSMLKIHVKDLIGDLHTIIHRIEN